MNLPQLQLLNAADAGDLEAASDALSYGANVNSSRNGITALATACFRGHLEIVELLLSHGADPNAGDEPALISAAWQGHIDIVRRIAPLANDKLTALRFASYKGHADMLEVLLDAGARPDRQLELTSACGHGFIEIVKLFLKAGADINAFNSYDETALMEAASHGQTEIVRLLLSLGATVELADQKGRTAIDKATGGEIESLLLDHIGRRDPHLACSTCRAIKSVEELLDGELPPLTPEPGGFFCPSCGSHYKLGPRDGSFRGHGDFVEFRLLTRIPR